ncbi:hypothetical protein ACSX1C_00285 [Pseudomonas sp. MBLB4123]|uniref:hypothetical protein n=1 Tax=Pseudomonas sp. MBLB4123 TaxID=3451557 RepID=UPI003F754357
MHTALQFLNTALIAALLFTTIHAPSPQPYIDPLLLSERVSNRVVVEIQDAAFIQEINVRLTRLEARMAQAERSLDYETRIATSINNLNTTNNTIHP